MGMSPIFSVGRVRLCQEVWTLTMSRTEVPRASLVRAALEGKITNAEGTSASDSFSG